MQRRSTHHKAIVLDDVALDDLAVLLEQRFYVRVRGLVGKVANEDFKGAYAAKARHLCVT